jgi:UDP-N-acetylmuramate dehydrogenase
MVQSLKNYNTFGINATCKALIDITSIEQLHEVVQSLVSMGEKWIVLGGGSNILLRDNLDCTVLRIALKGIEILEESESQVFLRVSAGEEWHSFVEWCVQHDYSGIENLALIPGSVGAAPMQNIGAYGQEVRTVITNVHYYSLEESDDDLSLNDRVKSISNDECQFGYRDSIFKNELKGKSIILSVDFVLNKVHTINAGYKDVQEELVKHSIAQPTIQDVFNAVIAIRKRKLPDPKEIGNSGSFFKNPVITIEQYNSLLSQYPTLPKYQIDEATVKVPAGWLIEQAGFKGLRRGSAGVHKNQALVLVNYGDATGDEIYSLALEIQNTVLNNFGIMLEMEVNILPQL